MAQWLIIVSWVAVILGLLTALAIAFDVAAHPLHMKIMNVVWPITGLYLPIVGWLLHADMARRKPTRDMQAAHGGHPFWKSVFVSTTHCAAGCVIGDIIGAPIVFWAGWTLFGSRLYAEFLVLFVLAYIFGIAFQYLPIRAMRRISRRDALVEAIKADTLALTAFEIGLFAWMAYLFSVRTAVRANIAYLLVHDADWYGSRLHRQLPGQLVSSSRGRETWHVSPTSFLQCAEGSVFIATIEPTTLIAAHPQARSIAPAWPERGQRRVPIGRHSPKSAETGEASSPSDADPRRLRRKAPTLPPQKPPPSPIAAE